MNLIGLSWSQFFIIFSGLGAAVVILYFLKLRRRSKLISSSLLWRRVLEQNKPQSLIERLRWLLSLLLALTFVFLLVMALAQPRLSLQAQAERWIVLLVDSSASMQALEGNQTRFDLAKREAARIIGSLAARDWAMLVRLDAENQTIAPFTRDKERLQYLIETLAPGQTPARLAHALSLANDALRGRPNGQIVIISDGCLSKSELAASPIKPLLARIGSAIDNVGITAFSVRKQVSEALDFDVLLEISNFGKAAQSFNLKIFENGDLIDVKPIEIQPQTVLRKVYTNFSPQGGLLRVELDIKDGLALDNQAFAYLPTNARQRVLLVSRGNLFLESALSADPSIALEIVAPHSFDKNADFDLIVFDNCSPEYSGRANLIYFNPTGDATPVEIAGEIQDCKVTDLSQDHPLLRYVAFKDVAIKSAIRIKPKQGDLLLARSGDNPLIIARNEPDGRRVLVLAFDAADIERSDLPLRLAFPLLVANAIRWSGSAGTPDVPSVRAGDTAILPVGSRSGQALIRGPDLTKTVQFDNGELMFTPRASGVYEIDLNGSSRKLVSNLVSAEESNLAPADDLEQVVSKFDDYRRKAGLFGQPLWVYLTITALMLILIEWIAYHRRWTV